jgi:hypothetical protein
MMRTYWALLSAGLRARLAELRRHPDAGYTTETVVITALLVVAALTVVTIIVGKVVTKANSINLGL